MCFPSYVQPYDKARNAVALALSPVVRALVDPDGAMRNIRDLDNVCVLSLTLAPIFLVECVRKLHIKSRSRSTGVIIFFGEIEKRTTEGLS